MLGFETYPVTEKSSDEHFNSNILLETFKPYISWIVLSKLLLPLVFTIILSLLLKLKAIFGFDKASFSIKPVQLLSSVTSLFKYLSLAGVL